MERIKIKNFRKIKETWELNLAPITFLVGTNNSGKSSVLKAIMTLDDFGESNNHFQLSFNGRNKRKHKIDSYSNAVNWHNQKNKQLDFEMEFEHLEYKVFISFTPHSWEGNKLIKASLKELFFQRLRDGAKLSLERRSQTEYQFYAESAFFERRRIGEELDDYNQNIYLRNELKTNIENLQKEKESIVEIGEGYIKLNQDIERLSKKLALINKKIRSAKERKKQEDIVFSPKVLLDDLAGEDFSIDRVIRLAFSRYFRENEKMLGLTDSRRDLHRAMMLGDKLQEVLNFHVEHLSPHRNNQTRLYINDETSSDIYEIINAHSIDPIPKQSKAGSFIKDWMKEFDIGEDYKISSVHGEASTIHIKEKVRQTNDNGNQKAEKEDWINLVDKGFGAGQVFTIILRIAMSIHENRKTKKFHFGRRRKFTPIILIEEPEANLHPKLQFKLTDLFEEAYRKYGIRFIVETHSEYLIRNSQVLVKNMGISNDSSELFFEKKNNDDKPVFAVYYFGEEKGPYRMHYDEEGKFIEDFGEGFFDVSRKLTRKLL